MGDVKCIECGMICEPNEFHPYAACLMYKQCRDSDTVRSNLHGVKAIGILQSYDEITRLTSVIAERDATCEMFKKGLQAADDKCIDLQGKITELESKIQGCVLVPREVYPSILKVFDSLHRPPTFIPGEHYMTIVKLGKQQPTANNEVIE